MDELYQAASCLHVRTTSSVILALLRQFRTTKQAVSLSVLATILLLAFMKPLNAFAQGASTTQPDASPHNEFGVFGVFPLANGSLKGVTSDRRFFLFGLSYSHLLARTKVCDFRWASEIVPLELLAEPFIQGTDLQALTSVPPFTETRVTYGLGTNPVGAEVVFLPGRRLQPLTGVHLGISYFTRNVLASHAAQLNFMIDGRVGVRFPMQSGKSLTFSYMFQHMSNAYTALENPGVDSHMIHVAYTFPFHGHTR